MASRTCGVRSQMPPETVRGGSGGLTRTYPLCGISQVGGPGKAGSSPSSTVGGAGASPLTRKISLSAAPWGIGTVPTPPSMLPLVTVIGTFMWNGAPLCTVTNGSIVPHLNQ